MKTITKFPHRYTETEDCWIPLAEAVEGHRAVLVRTGPLLLQPGVSRRLCAAALDPLVHAKTRAS